MGFLCFPIWVWDSAWLSSTTNHKATSSKTGKVSVFSFAVNTICHLCTCTAKHAQPKLSTGSLLSHQIPHTGARACSNSLASPECCLWNLPFSFLKYSLGSVNATSKGYRRCMEWFVTPELVSLILPSLHEKKLQCNLFLF